MKKKAEWCLSYYDGNRCWDTGWHKAKSAQAAKVAATDALRAATYSKDAVHNDLWEAVVEVRYEWGDLAAKFTKHKNRWYGNWVRVKV
jgi:hypothetical protein